MQEDDVVRQVKDRLVGRRGGGGDDDGDGNPGAGGHQDAVDEDDLYQLQLQAQTALYDLHEFVTSAIQMHGLNQDLWLEHWSEDAGELRDFLDRLDAAANGFLDAYGQETKVALSSRDPAELRRLTERCRDFHQTLMVFLERAQRAHRELMARRAASSSSSTPLLSSSSGGTATSGSAYLAAPLMNFASGHDQKSWSAAQKRVTSGKGCVFVFVRADIASQISGLFAQYTKLWNAASVDGFKGANFAKFRQMTEILEKIISLLASSDEILTHASVCPGTVFFDMLMRLLKQSCGSREVMELKRWWDSIAKPPPPK